jgi:DNA-binding MarR family transcriptional regulator
VAGSDRVAGLDWVAGSDAVAMSDRVAGSDAVAMSEDVAGSSPESVHAAPEQSPGFLLWRTTLAWQRRIRAALAPHGLTHVQFVLLASLWWLEQQGDPPTQAALAGQAGVDSMMASQVVRKLEDRGLLDRRPDPGDRRARRLGLTVSGRALLAGALADVEATDAAYFAGLGARREGFVAALETLIAADS